MDFLDFLTETDGDMVERGLILAASVVVTVPYWLARSAWGSWAGW